MAAKKKAAARKTKYSGVTRTPSGKLKKAGETFSGEVLS